MAKNTSKKDTKTQNKNPKTETTQEDDAAAQQVNKIYKRILRTMSWTVGSAFILVILLPEFNTSFLDRLTRYIFLLGIITLLAFILIEFIGDQLKKLIRYFLSSKHAKNSNR